MPAGRHSGRIFTGSINKLIFIYCCAIIFIQKKNETGIIPCSGDLYNEPLFYELNLYERACLDYLIERINEISIDPDENFKSIELKDELLKTAVDEAVAGMTEVR